MNKKASLRILYLGFLLVIASCSSTENLVVLHQVTGPIKTNCYLLYDQQFKEAALIDVGGSIDSLIEHLDKNNLTLKYIFATHGHIDHLEGVPQISKIFPEAQVCYNKEDYNDFLNFIDWLEKNWPQEEIDGMKQNPDLVKWFEYDMAIFKEPDIYLEDNQVFELGNLKIKTILSPGHSRGSICFYIENALFSGDVLFHKSVGRTDLMGGSEKAIVKSVLSLYDNVPDKTIVYPGHGQFTDIGFEKINNKEVSTSTLKLEN